MQRRDTCVSILAGVLSGVVVAAGLARFLTVPDLLPPVAFLTYGVAVGTAVRHGLLSRPGLDFGWDWSSALEAILGVALAELVTALPAGRDHQIGLAVVVFGFLMAAYARGVVYGLNRAVTGTGSASAGSEASPADAAD